VHVETFGDRTNPEVPTYAVTPTANGFQADYLSTVSNYPKHLKHLNPPGFKSNRLVKHRVDGRYDEFWVAAVDLDRAAQTVGVSSATRLSGRSARPSRIEAR